MNSAGAEQGTSQCRTQHKGARRKKHLPISAKVRCSLRRGHPVLGQRAQDWQAHPLLPGLQQGETLQAGDQGAVHGHGCTATEGNFVKTGFIVFSGSCDASARKAGSHLCQLIGISKAHVIRRWLSYTSEVIRMRTAFLPLQIPT